MTIISLIAAIDECRGLGQGNQLLCHLPADLKHFKELTLGKPIIMGRKTFESIGRVLPGRLNVILSHQTLSIDGAIVVGSLRQALTIIHDVPEVMVIGGATVFEQALPLAQRVYLTLIHHQFDADVFFPLLDENTWLCSDTVHQPSDAKNSYEMTFYCYERFTGIVSS